MLNNIVKRLRPYILLLLCTTMLAGSLVWNKPKPSPALTQPQNEELEEQAQVAEAELPPSASDQPPAQLIITDTVNEEPVLQAKQATAQQSRPKPSVEIPQRGGSQHPVPKPVAAKTDYSSAKQDDLNHYVLQAINTYHGRTFPYLLDTNYATYNGVTSNIYYQGNLLLKAHPSGNRASHCVGITFEVFFKAMQARNKAAGLAKDNFNTISPAEMTDLMLMWYVSGPKAQYNLALAIEKYGLGRRIGTLSAARAGDFIDFSRTNGTGHAAVFIDWIKRNEQIVGLRYWSSQGSTGGIAFTEEYFATENSYGIRWDRIYLARVGPINNYR